ncbi:helix-turn-helix domain-containing protein [Sporichthya brevicatena]|uniref:TetR/AcrR family transcriptional regulator n=1 Tax=Sporichthya brevicatena TaxID=171442 RepID=UPI0031E03CDD
MTPPVHSATRTYDSRRRRESAAETRRDVIAAATRLFTARGWARTSVRDIAKEARVSVETVYSAVGSKAEILRAALDVSVVGDDEPVPLADRPEFRALAAGSPAERARAVADLLAGIYPRTAPLERALEHGAAADPALVDLCDWAYRNQRETAAQALALVLGRAPTDAEADGAHALFSNSAFLQLTERAGWSLDTYRTWIAESVLRLYDLDDSSHSGDS